MAASRITVKCPHGHEINTGVRGRGVSCRCGATVYVRADGSTRLPAEAHPAARFAGATQRDLRPGNASGPRHPESARRTGRWRPIRDRRR